MMSRKAGEKRIAFTQQRSFLFGQQREGGLAEPLSQRDKSLLLDDRASEHRKKLPEPAQGE